MSAKTRIHSALLEAGHNGLTTAQLCQPDLGGVRFGARIHDLRGEGYRITETRLRAGSSRYVLAPAVQHSLTMNNPPSQPSLEAVQPPLLELTFDEAIGPASSMYDQDAA